MPKIAICDDEQPIREYLKSLTEKCIPDSQVRLFGSGEALLRDQTSFDVILLDVSLRGEDGNQTLNGMETARKIRETSNAMIIFVTAFKEYVFEGYDVGAFHYLLKPVDEHKFAEVMQRAMWQLEREKEEMSLLIKADGSYMEVLAKNILYAENEARKIDLLSYLREFEPSNLVKAVILFMRKWKCWRSGWERVFSVRTGDFW